MGIDFFPRNKNSILLGAMVSLFALVMIVAAGERLKIGTILFVFAYSFLCEALGQYLLKLGHLEGLKARLSAAYLLGFLFTSALMYVLVIWISWSVQISMAATGFVSVVVLATLKRRDEIETDGKIDHEALLLIPLLVLAAVALYKYAAIPVRMLSEGRLNIWNDYYIHGVTLESLGGRFAYGGSFEIVGEALSKYYHYVPYMFASAVISIQDMDGFSAALSVLLPQGMLVCTLGIFVVCVQLSNFKTGLVAAILTMAIPGYLVFFQSGWLDPYWNVFIHPGAGYALALCVLAIASVQLYSVNPSKRTLATLCILTLLVGVTRFHFLLLLAPLLAWVAIPQVNKGNPYRWLKGLVATMVVLLLVSAFVISSDGGLVAYAKTVDYLKINASQLLFYGEKLYSALPNDVVSILALIGVMLVATIGVYLIIYPVLIIGKIKYKTLVMTDLVPFFLLVVFVCFMIYAPVARNADLTEYKHRHFPFVYLVFSVYCNVWAAHWLDKNTSCFANDKKYFVGVGFLLLMTLPLASFTEPAKPNFKSMQWATVMHGNKVEKDKLDLARFIKKNSTQGDVFLSPAPLLNYGQTTTNSFATEIISLSGVPAYLSRTNLFGSMSDCTGKLVTERKEVASAIANAKNWNEAATLMRNNRIRWYVYDNKSFPGWVLTGVASFANPRFAVYDAGHTAGKYKVFKDCPQ